MASPCGSLFGPPACAGVSLIAALLGAGYFSHIELPVGRAVETCLAALLVGLAIVLRDVDANSRNTIVKGVHEGANFFAGAFAGLVTFKGHAKREITVDWGIALLVYLILGALLARSIARIGRTGLSYGQARRLAS
jgi:hypothetical protein